MKFLKILLKNIGILIIVLIVLALINRWYLGGFTRLAAREQNMGPYTVAYIHVVGNYGKVGPSMTKVYEILSGAGIVSSTGVGIYYDDPAIISGDLLRSDIGASIDPQDLEKLKNITDIQTKTLVAGNKIVLEFPLKNTFSSMIGPMRAYPVIVKYMKDNGYTTEVPMVELYDILAKKIYYIAEVRE